MKARNPSTGTLETVYVKALDSLPVGTEVDFDGDSADIPTGWELIGNNYSTNEVKTGQTWIDGKPIYRKVYTGTTGTGGSWEDISISNLNIDTLIDLKYNFGTSEHYTSSFYVNATYNLVVRLNDNGNIQYQYGVGYSNQDYIITIEYTKTTD